MAEYLHPEVLVSTQWAAEHLNDPRVRLIEVELDTAAYDQGHIPGAKGWNWQTQLPDSVRRDLIQKSAWKNRSEIRSLKQHHGSIIRRQQQLVCRLCTRRTSSAAI